MIYSSERKNIAYRKRCSRNLTKHFADKFLLVFLVDKNINANQMNRLRKDFYGVNNVSFKIYPNSILQAKFNPLLKLNFDKSKFFVSVAIFNDKQFAVDYVVWKKKNSEIVDKIYYLDPSSGLVDSEQLFCFKNLNVEHSWSKKIVFVAIVCFRLGFIHLSILLFLCVVVGLLKLFDEKK